MLLAFGLSFWANADGPARIFALAVLIPLTGMILGLYLSGLAILPAAPETSTVKSLFRSANLFLLRRPLPVAGGVVVLLTWFALSSVVPTLLRRRVRSGPGTHGVRALTTASRKNF